MLTVWLVSTALEPSRCDIHHHGGGEGPRTRAGREEGEKQPETASQHAGREGNIWISSCKSYKCLENTTQSFQLFISCLAPSLPAPTTRRVKAGELQSVVLTYAWQGTEGKKKKKSGIKMFPKNMAFSFHLIDFLDLFTSGLHCLRSTRSQTTVHLAKLRAEHFSGALLFPPKDRSRRAFSWCESKPEKQP